MRRHPIERMLSLSKRAVAAVVLLGSCALWVGCATRSAAPGHRPRAAPRGPIVARVAGDVITADDVAAVARAEGLHDARAALERTIGLALLAQEAARRRLDRDPLVRDTAWRALVQELLVRDVERAVRDEDLSVVDIETGMRIRGFELSHGPLYRTQHVVMRVARDAPLEARERARSLAVAVRERLLALPMPRVGEPFQREAVAAAGSAEHRVEMLPPIDRTGRHTRGELVPAYATAAAALATPGDISPVVETEFGFHVIGLVEVVPSNERPEREVQALVRGELAARLRRRELDTYLAALRRRHRVEIAAGAEQAAERMVAGQGPR